MDFFIFFSERWLLHLFCSFTLALSQAGKGLQGNNNSSPVDTFILIISLSKELKFKIKQNDAHNWTK